MLLSAAESITAFTRSLAVFLVYVMALGYVVSAVYAA